MTVGFEAIERFAGNDETGKVQFEREGGFSHGFRARNISSKVILSPKLYSRPGYNARRKDVTNSRAGLCLASRLESAKRPLFSARAGSLVWRARLISRGNSRDASSFISRLTSRAYLQLIASRGAIVRVARERRLRIRVGMCTPQGNNRTSCTGRVSARGRFYSRASVPCGRATLRGSSPPAFPFHFLRYNARRIPARGGLLLLLLLPSSCVRYLVTGTPYDARILSMDRRQSFRTRRCLWRRRSLDYYEERLSTFQTRV